MSNLPMSKDEILEKNNAGGAVADKKYRQLFGHRERLYEAMDEYAKQEAIGFAKWKDSKGYVPRQNPDSTIPQWGWMRQENQIIWSKWVNDDELYSIYQQQKEGK